MPFIVVVVETKEKKRVRVFAIKMWNINNNNNSCFRSNNRQGRIVYGSKSIYLKLLKSQTHKKAGKSFWTEMAICQQGNSNSSSEIITQNFPRKSICGFLLSIFSSCSFLSTAFVYADRSSVWRTNAKCVFPDFFFYKFYKFRDISS